MRKPVLFIITLMLAGCLASCSGSPTPKEFKSATGRFAVMTPAPLQEEAKALETEAGKIDLHLFAGQLDDIAYVIAYSDYPPEAAPPGYAEKMLDGARNGAVGNTNGGKLVSETNISLTGYPGRELVIAAQAEDRPPMTIKGRIFMVKNRLYQVTVVAPRGKAGDKVIDDFLQSFKLLGP
jgi:hypothetical protein